MAFKLRSGNIHSLTNGSGKKLRNPDRPLKKGEMKYAEEHGSTATTKKEFVESGLRGKRRRDIAFMATLGIGAGLMGKEWFRKYP